MAGTIDGAVEKERDQKPATLAEKQRKLESGEARPRARAAQEVTRIAAREPERGLSWCAEPLEPALRNASRSVCGVDTRSDHPASRVGADPRPRNSHPGRSGHTP